jgi:hypothetical protein
MMTSGTNERQTAPESLVKPAGWAPQPPVQLSTDTNALPRGSIGGYASGNNTATGNLNDSLMTYRHSRCAFLAMGLVRVGDVVASSPCLAASTRARSA